MSNLSSEINKNSGISEDEYPIIWYQPEIDFALKEKAVAHFFSEFQEILNFAESLKTSFLLIVPNDFDEQELLEKLSQDLYGRRLADFEEEVILEGFDVKSFKVYVFCTKEDFESEVFVEENVMKWDDKELEIEFREEFIFWERKHRGLEKADAVFERPEKPEEFECCCCNKENHLLCKAFCIKNLKELAHKRRQEKKKLMYYVNLGDSFSHLDESKKALEYYMRAVDIVKGIYGETNASITSLFRSIAYIYKDLGENEKALEFSLKAFDLSKLLYGEQHFEMTFAYRCSVFLYSSLEDFQKALEYQMKAFDIVKAIYGEAHFKLADSYVSLAFTYKKMKEYQTALEYNRKALEMRREIFGEMHPSIADSYHRLAFVYEDLTLTGVGYPQEAENFSYSNL